MKHPVDGVDRRVVVLGRPSLVAQDVRVGIVIDHDVQHLVRGAHLHAGHVDGVDQQLETARLQSTRKDTRARVVVQERDLGSGAEEAEAVAGGLVEAARAPAILRAWIAVVELGQAPLVAQQPVDRRHRVAQRQQHGIIGGDVRRRAGPLQEQRAAERHGVQVDELVARRDGVAVELHARTAERVAEEVQPRGRAVEVAAVILRDHV